MGSFWHVGIQFHIHNCQETSVLSCTCLYDNQQFKFFSCLVRVRKEEITEIILGYRSPFPRTWQHKICACGYISWYHKWHHIFLPPLSCLNPYVTAPLRVLLLPSGYIIQNWLKDFISILLFLKNQSGLTAALEERVQSTEPLVYQNQTDRNVIIISSHILRGTEHIDMYIIQKLVVQCKSAWLHFLKWNCYPGSNKIVEELCLLNHCSYLGQRLLLSHLRTFESTMIEVEEERHICGLN